MQRPWGKIDPLVRGIARSSSVGECGEVGTGDVELLSSGCLPGVYMEMAEQPVGASGLEFRVDKEAGIAGLISISCAELCGWMRSPSC